MTWFFEDASIVASLTPPSRQQFLSKSSLVSVSVKDWRLNSPNHIYAQKKEDP
jgi:hypothetical protein